MNEKSRQPRVRARDDGAATAAAAAAPASKQTKTSASAGVSLGASEVVERTATFDFATEAHVAVFPTLVPMEYKYTSKYYFVRDCYHEYYQLVFDLFNEGKVGVTISGTPGIGKSVLMGYFFQRYSAEYPKATITMASFDEDSILNKVVTARGGKQLDKVSVAPHNDQLMVKHMDDTEDEHKIWLLDGPPDHITPRLRFVAFTSPNERWSDKRKKMLKIYPTVYMPVWTLAELSDAVRQLKGPDLLKPIDNRLLVHLGLSSDELDESQEKPSVIKLRFDLFGGVPRVCFEDEYAAFVLAVTNLQTAVNGLTADQVVAAITATETPVIVHRLLHYVPVATYPWGDPSQFRFATIQVASSAIERLLTARKQAVLNEEQKNFTDIARYVPEMKTTQGYFIEARTYRKLDGGCTIEAEKLSGQGDPVLKVVVPPQRYATLISNTFTISDFDRTQLQVGAPWSKNLQSTDGFIWIPETEELPSRVVLFQVTVSPTHPVKALGLSKVLEGLGHWEAVQQSPHTAAALVFVVPAWSKKAFKAQRVLSQPHLDDHNSVNSVVGIGDATQAQLKMLHIATVGDLRTIKALDDLGNIPVVWDGDKVVETLEDQWRSGVRIERKDRDVVEQALLKLERHESGAIAGTDGSNVESVLRQIPQHAWGIE